ncbi:unnamed protein product [Parnassius mnemosyne]|uniref:Uncharacterized protein n=1 Tax=Parnassius mnemosyne TaxID=213953 RepID=A0AAV1KZX9_9NEOP
MFQLRHQEIPVTRITACTDSSAVLAWLNTPPYKLKTYASRRVAKITDKKIPLSWEEPARYPAGINNI